MNKQGYLTVTFLCGLSISSCSSVTNTSYTPYQEFSYASIHDYPQSDNIPNNSRYEYQQVIVPESYHVGAFQSPTSHQDRDKNWIEGQKSQFYTIQVSDEESAAGVANKLMKMPRNERTAEIKYIRNGKTYYKGFFGSYKSEEEARKAFNKLPTDVKLGAGIKSWGTVQNATGE